MLRVIDRIRSSVVPDSNAQQRNSQRTERWKILMASLSSHVLRHLCGVSKRIKESVKPEICQIYEHSGTLDKSPSRTRSFSFTAASGGKVPCHYTFLVLNGNQGRVFLRQRILGIPAVRESSAVTFCRYFPISWHIRRNCAIAHCYVIVYGDRRDWVLFLVSARNPLSSPSGKTATKQPSGDSLKSLLDSARRISSKYWPPEWLTLFATPPQQLLTCDLCIPCGQLVPGRGRLACDLCIPCGQLVPGCGRLRLTSVSPAGSSFRAVVG